MPHDKDQVSFMDFLRRLWWALHDHTLTDRLKWKTNAWKRRMLGERNAGARPYAVSDIPPRWELIQAVIDRYGFRSYLEIGCAGNACFDKVRCDLKVGVDPVSGGTERKTSDAFFAENRQRFDCIFIDGLHKYAQVRQDIRNALDASTENAVVFLHDCLPRTIGEQAVPREQLTWMGDVWKAIVEYRCQPAVDTAVCTIDCGIGIVVKRPNTLPLALGADRDFQALSFGEYLENHEQWMRPMNYESALQFIGGEVSDTDRF